MGAYTCEYGVVHRVCRCPTPHTIKCDKVEEHKDHNYVPKHRKEPAVKYRITIIKREYGQVVDKWNEVFDTSAQAWTRIDEVNFKGYGGPPHLSTEAIRKITEVAL